MNEYLMAVVGGILIGLSALILLLFNGRIAGISGIAWRSWQSSVEQKWQWLFIIGLLLGTWLAHSQLNITVPQLPDNNVGWIVLAGFLVGFGAKLGSGCTSGHGICGIGRLSKRSFIATSIFMSTGILSVFLSHFI
ncbi:YeeE/YedE family protein [Catenovulum sediminis]|uniref:YeeE/YedE family protein n=1 Tax=Catenovulum sediminis TaxID=1740262 RepID=A0ABV1RFK3_9ALTE|nr:YeeE/YedE family protein [Catenovulum sediminis]